MVSSTVSHTTSKNTSNGATKHARIINITHMIPYTPVLESVQNSSNPYKWTLEPRRGHSALYSGLKSLSSNWDNHYVGYIGTILDTEEKPIGVGGYPEELKQSL